MDEATARAVFVPWIGVNNRPVSPVLRPHLISRRQYTNLVKTAESLHSAIDRVRDLALQTPSLLAKMEILPAEKMLAAVDPGYSIPSVASLLGSHVNNGHMHFTGSQADLRTVWSIPKCWTRSFLMRRP